MICTIIKRSRIKVSNSFVSRWLTDVESALRKKKILSRANTHLVVVFVSDREIRNLNGQYRHKDSVTDILSFPSYDPGVLGELVVAPSVVKKQAREHGLTFEKELGYMLLHGVLHLLGFDHEKSQKQARQMFKIQDDVFYGLCQTVSHVSTSRKRRSKKKSRASA